MNITNQNQIKQQIIYHIKSNITNDTYESSYSLFLHIINILALLPKYLQKQIHQIQQNQDNITVILKLNQTSDTYEQSKIIIKTKQIIAITDITTE